MYIHIYIYIYIICINTNMIPLISSMKYVLCMDSKPLAKWDIPKMELWEKSKHRSKRWSATVWPEGFQWFPYGFHRFRVAYLP